MDPILEQPQQQPAPQQQPVLPGQEAPIDLSGGMDPLNPPQEPINILAGLDDSNKTQTMDDDALKRRSSMYGIAKMFDEPGPEGFDDLMAGYDNQRQIIQESIKLLGDMDVRRSIQLNATNQVINNLANMQYQNPEAAPIARQAAAMTLQRQAAEKESMEAERVWAENLLLLRDTGRGDLADLTALDNQSPTLFEEQVRIMSTKAMLMKMIEENNVEMEDRGWFWAVTDWLMTNVPFSTTWANSDNFDTEVTNWYDGIFSGERKEAEANSWWYAMVRAPNDTVRREIAQRFMDGLNRNTNFMFGQNKLIKQTVLNELMAKQEADVTNIFDGMLNLPTISGGIMRFSKAFRVPFTSSNVLKASGNNPLVVSRTAKAVEEIAAGRAQTLEKTVGMTLEEVEDNILPSSVNPNKVKPLDPNHTPAVDDVAMQLDELFELGLKDVEELLGDMVFSERLNDVERANLKADLLKRTETLGQVKKQGSGSTYKRHVADHDLIPIDIKTGQTIYVWEAVLGQPVKKGRPTWYATETTATTAAQKLTVPYQIVPQEGGFGIKIRAPIDESGQTLAGARIYNPFKDKQTGGAWSWLTKHVGGKVAAAEELHGAAGVASSKYNLIIKKINESILPTFYKISNEERHVLRHTLAGGERMNTWFTNAELNTIYKANFKDGDPTKFIDAYTAAWKLNDMEWVLRNLEDYVTLSSQGYGKTSFHGISGISKVIRNATVVPDELIVSVGDDINDLTVHVDTLAPGVKPKKGKSFTQPRMSSQDLIKAQQNGKTLIRMRDAQRVMMNGKPIYSRYFLVKTADVVAEELSPVGLIPYKAGGHRMYRGKYFPKLPVMREQAWGDKILDKPFTPTVAVSQADGLLWVKEANVMREAYKAAIEANKTPDEIVEILEGLAEKNTMGHPPVEEFIGWMKEYGFDEAFELVYDRELPSAYRKQGIFSMADEDVSGVSTFLETQGQMYTSRKGPVLKDVTDWNKDGADTIDPFVMINRSLANVARLTSFTDFKLRGVNKWLSTYGHALSTRNMLDPNPMRLFLEGEFDTRTKEGKLLAQQANIQRDYIKRILGWKTDSDLAAEAAGRNLIESVAGLYGPGKGSRAVHKFQNWWLDNKPINALVGMAFDSTMGFWNPGQFPLQMQTAFGAATIDPIRGPGAMANMIAVMHYMRKGATDADLRQYVKWGWHKANGFEDPESYMAMLRELKKSGWMENMAAVLKNEYGPNAAMGNIGRGLEAVRNNGRIFLDKAEELNRAVAWQIAWRRVAEMPQYKHLKMGTAAHSEKVASLARTFAFNMDEAGAAWWQKNPLAKLPTQFMGYMARWHEQLWNPDFAKVFNKTDKGIKVDLKSEKIRFVIGQYAMYGYAGIPLIAGFTDFYERKTGKVADIDSVEGLLARGFWDSLIFKTTGLDVGFSERAGIGSYPTDIVMELFGYSKYGEIATADIALGATYQIGKDAAGSLGRMFGYMAAESGGDMGRPLTEHAVVTVARHISTLNNVLKAKAILEYGKYTNRYGQAIGKDVPSAYAFAALLGLTPGDMQKLTAELGWLEDQKNEAKEWSKQILIYREQVANAIADGNYAEADKISEAVNFLTRVVIPKNIRAEALAEADKNKDMTGIVESVARRVEEEMAKDQMNQEEGSN